LFGFTKKKGPTLALDINSDSISILGLEKGKTGYQLTYYAKQPTPPNVVREGLITDPDTVGSIVQELVQQAGVSPSAGPPRLNIAVPGQSVVIRLMPVPVGMPDDELADVVGQEAINHVPFPMAEANLDWSIMQATERTDGDGVRRVDVILAAIQKAVVDSYWRMADAAGVKIGDITTSSLATIRALSFADYLNNDERLIMAVNVRQDATDINLIRSGMPLFTRSVLLGIETLAEAISRSLEVRLDEALKLLPQIPLFGMTPMVVDPKIGQAAQIARTVFGDIIDEVARSLEFYRSQVGEVQIEQIVLCGPGAVIPQVDQFLSNRLNIETVIANPLSGVSYDNILLPDERRAAYTMAFGTVIDTAWCNVPTVELDLNKDGPSADVVEDFGSRPTVQVFEEDTPWFMPALGAGLGIAIVVGGLWAYSSQYDAPKKQAELEALNLEITNGKKQVDTLKALKDENIVLQQKKQLLDGIVKHAQQYSSILQTVSTDSPAGIQFDKVELTSDSLKVEGRAIDFANVSNFALNLGTSPLLHDSTINFAERQKTDPRVIEFQVTAKTAPPSTLEIKPKQLASKAEAND
jgi:type IV pilus assembly protein PilM